MYDDDKFEQHMTPPQMETDKEQIMVVSFPQKLSRDDDDDDAIMIMMVMTVLIMMICYECICLKLTKKLHPA